MARLAYGCSMLTTLWLMMLPLALGAVYFWSTGGTPKVLFDSGSVAMHSRCCCGCAECADCDSNGAPHSVSVVFNEPGGFRDVTPPMCDDDNDNIASAGECAAALNEIAWILDCDDEGSSTCDYTAAPVPPAANPHPFFERCAGTGTTGSFYGLTFSWREDRTGSAGYDSPRLVIGQACLGGGYYVHGIQYVGAPSYPIDCKTTTWNLSHANDATFFTCLGYPCAFQGPASVDVDAVP